MTNDLGTHRTPGGFFHWTPVQCISGSLGRSTRDKEYPLHRQILVTCVHRVGYRLIKMRNGPLVEKRGRDFGASWRSPQEQADDDGDAARDDRSQPVDGHVPTGHMPEEGAQPE
jgi:hypothetical protein